MTHGPRTQETIFNNIRDSLKGKITKLRNFTGRSFNRLWVQAFSSEIRRLEVLSTVSELAGWIDYTGGPVDETDLDNITVEVSGGPDETLADRVSAEEINDLMEKDYLDEYVKIVGVSRFPASRATGTVTIDTQLNESVTIPEGTRVTTELNESGETVDFLTTDAASTTDTESSVSGVPIQAVDAGQVGNVGAGTIIRLADPPIGVRGVTNPESTTGGQEEESNEELRSRSKRAVQSSSLGGTVAGIKGYIRQNIEGVGEGDVALDEFFEGGDGLGGEPPFVDVIVNGGDEPEVLDAIDFSRPTGIRHNLVRPQVVQLGFDTEVDGIDIDTSSDTGVAASMNSFLLGLGIGDSFLEDEMIRLIMESDTNIENIDNLGGMVERVTNEEYDYTSGEKYRLDYTYENDATSGSIDITDDSGDTYIEGTDFSVEDHTGDGWPETVVWSGNATPDSGETFSVDYDVTVFDETAPTDVYDTTLSRDEKFIWENGKSDSFTLDLNRERYQLDAVPFVESTSITDGSGDSYSEGVEYELVNNTNNDFSQSINWFHNVTYFDRAIAEDGGSFIEETTAASNETEDDMTLLPPNPSVDDAYYFGDSSTTFSELHLDVSTVGDGDWSVKWEYYSSNTGWTDLSGNGLADGTNAFRKEGVSEVSWTIPGDWVTTSVDGNDIFWVRARVDSFTSVDTAPKGRNVYRNDTPDDNEDFTVTYNKRLYEPEYDIRETLNGVIRSREGSVTGPWDGGTGFNTYQEGTDYQIVDYNDDRENDAIEWLSNPFSDGDIFFFTYITEGDIFFTIREKSDPGTIEVSTN